LLFGPDDHVSCRFAVAQHGDHSLYNLQLRFCLPVAAAGTLDQVQRAPLEAFEVGEHQLGLDRLGVADRIERALDMGDIVVCKAAQHVSDRVDFANMGQELIAEPLTAGGAANQPGNVDELELGRDDVDRFRQTGADGQPIVRHGDAADIGLDRAERIIGRVCGRRCGQRVEQGRLADIRQSDDTAGESHAAELQSGSGRPNVTAGSVSGGVKRRATSLMKASGAPDRRRPIVSATASSSGATQRLTSSLGKFCKT